MWTMLKFVPILLCTHVKSKTVCYIKHDGIKCKSGCVRLYKSGILYRTLLTVFLFEIRCFGTAYFQSVGLFTAEVSADSLHSVLHHQCQVYPTSIRAFGMSLCASVSRIGGMVAPHIAQVQVYFEQSSQITIIAM